MAKLTKAVSLLALAIAGAGVASGVQTPQNAGLPTAKDVLIETVRPGSAFEQYVAEVTGELRRADRQDDGLDSADVKLVRDMAAAQMRADLASKLLQQDLDGDMVVTREEIERGSSQASDYLASEIDRQISQFDSNGDGKIALAEALATQRGKRRSDRLDGLLALDPNRDGKLTALELRSLAEQTFAGIDSNGDGRISDEEYRRIEPRVVMARSARGAPTCALPEVPDGAKLIVFGTYEADAISSTVIGKQDEETNLLDVTIEQGSEPLYLVLTSHQSMIWRVNGATGRVANVVASSFADAGGGISAAGVIGVPRSKVTIAEQNCPHFFSEIDREAASAFGTVRRTLSREPSSMFATYSAQRISLPSGLISKAEAGSAPLPAGFDAQTWREAARFWAAGLVQTNHRQVVSKAPAEPYKVYPSQIGLSQLVGTGAVTRQPDGSFRIVRPIPHMPPGMGGAHSVRMTLAKGVPLPPGDPAHTCVLVEDTGKAFGPTCRMQGWRR